MWKNYITIALRNLWMNKTFSLINIAGLTVGTACCLYILLFVQDHRGFDRHHEEPDRLYRIISDLQLPNGQHDMHMATCSPPIPMGVLADFPEVAAAARVCSPPGVEQNLIRVGDQVFFEKKGFFVDSTFFRIFNFRFLAGDRQHALDEPFSVVISESLSKKLFHDAPAVGQTIGIGGNDGEEKFKVTGVFDTGLGKSHMQAEFFMTMNSGGIGEFIRTNDSWAGNNFVYGYLRLKPGADAARLESKLPAFLQRHGAAQLKQLGMEKSLHLQPVTEIHTTGGRTAELPGTTSAGFLNILLIIAGFIQLVACINFMNLSTARSTKRAKEVGVRKAIGAPRSALIGQFLGESMLMTGMATVLALPLVLLGMPLLNSLTGADVPADLMAGRSGVLLVVTVLLLTGLIAGSYPAFYLSSFQPLSVFRGFNASNGPKGAALMRKGLVVGQFALSSALILCALIIRFQLNYMLEKDLGFEKNQKVVVPFRTGESRRHLENFRAELTRLPEVEAASGVAVCPGQFLYNDLPLYKKGQDMNAATDVRFTYADENYLKTLKINLLEGRPLTAADTSVAPSTAKGLINQTALRKLGIAEADAPGMVLYSDFEDRHIEITVIGVMQDFMYQNLNSEIDPFMVLLDVPANLSFVVASVKTEDYPGFFKKAEAVWQKSNPGLPFDYSFLDDDIARMYRSERTLSHIIGAFTLIAIFISGLGLFGLSVFTAEQRTKEIGIRKVLGASVPGLAGLLAKDFLALVLLAILIASPLAWYFMDGWLADFAYHIDLSWWMFAAAGLLSIGLAFLTVSFQSIRAALAHPVRSLRSE